MAEKTLAEADGRVVWSLLERDAGSRFQTIPVTEQVHRMAESLLLTPGLRASDAIHVATALIVRAASDDDDVVFVSADRRQAAAAEANGLEVQLVE